MVVGATLLTAHTSGGHLATAGQVYLRRVHLLQPSGRRQARSGIAARPPRVREALVPAAGAAGVPRRRQPVGEPGLWSSIEQALVDSEFFVLLA
jgi:hypothetical protein